MKKKQNTKAKSALNAAFARINSSVGEELNEIVRIIETHGRKKKLKRSSKSVKSVRQLVEA